MGRRWIAADARFRADGAHAARAKSRPSPPHRLAVSGSRRPRRNIPIDRQSAAVFVRKLGALGGGLVARDPAPEVNLDYAPTLLDRWDGLIR